MVSKSCCMLTIHSFIYPLARMKIVLLPWPSLSFALKTFLLGVLQTAWHVTQAKLKNVHFLSRFSSSSTIRGININGINISPSSDARNLGVTVDSHLQMTKHGNNICKSAFIAIRNIGRIRKYLDHEKCERLVHTFVTSKLDSCNVFLLAFLTLKLKNCSTFRALLRDLLWELKEGNTFHLYYTIFTGFLLDVE